MNKPDETNGLALKSDLKTAVFYPVPELGHYLVEIHFQGDHHFITKRQQHQQFENIAAAKLAAKHAGAVEGYQALDNTYQELGAEVVHAKPHVHRYEYLKVNLE